jgi:hypothetical protein
LFKVTLWKRTPWPPLIGIAVLALLGLLAPAASPLALSTAAALVTASLALTAGRPGRFRETWLVRTNPLRADQPGERDPRTSS